MLKFEIMLERTKKQELTSRQLEILDLLRKGLTNGEICRALNISENTVKVHLANIYKIMDVTNRTEAASFASSLFKAPVKKQEVTIVIGHNDDIKNSPLAHSLFLSIIEALYGYRLFQIKICQMNEVTDDCVYQIKLSAPQEEKQALFISLYQADNSALLWSNLQRIENSDQIKLLSAQIAIRLYREMMLSATSAYEANPDSTPAWWYACSYASIKYENRSQKDFEASQNTLQEILKTEGNKDFISCTLASGYYMAIAEHWIDGEEYTRKIGEIACNTMRDTPNSTNSMFTMALYNILIGNKNEAITYFEAILEINPLCIITRRLLAQIYMLLDRQDEALKHLEIYDQFVPGAFQQPFHFVAKGLIYLMLGRYDECEQISNQVLMFHPEIPFARLFLIACNNKKGNQEESKKQIELFFQYHANFSQQDLERFIVGISPTQRNFLMGLVSNLFHK